MEESIKKISIVVPAYNESKNIETFLDKLTTLAKEDKAIAQIIVIDDGSYDNTAELIEKYNVDLISHVKRRGYGASLKDGIQKADGEHICIIDADNTYSVSDIPILKKYIEDHDMVVGARYDDTVRPKDHLAAKKSTEKILSKIFNFKVEDINSGLRIIRKDLIEKYLKILSNSFSFTSSITLIMLLKKAKIIYVPVRYERRKKGSKVRRLSFVFAFLQGYFKILWRYFLRKL